MNTKRILVILYLFLALVMYFFEDLVRPLDAQTSYAFYAMSLLFVWIGFVTGFREEKKKEKENRKFYYLVLLAGVGTAWIAGLMQDTVLHRISDKDELATTLHTGARCTSLIAHLPIPAYQSLAETREEKCFSLYFEQNLQKVDPNQISQYIELTANLFQRNHRYGPIVFAKMVNATIKNKLNSDPGHTLDESVLIEVSNDLLKLTENFDLQGPTQASTEARRKEVKATLTQVELIMSKLTSPGFGKIKTRVEALKTKLN